MVVHTSSTSTPESTVAPFLSLTVSHDPAQIEACVKQVTLATFPTWQEAELSLERCKNGITNKIYRVRNQNNGHEVLVRSFGRKSEFIINRDQEIQNFTMLAEWGLSPPLYARFINGLVYGYVKGTSLSPEEIRDKEKGRMIAEKLALWHTHHQQARGGEGEEKEEVLVGIMKKWLKEIPACYSNPETQGLFERQANDFDLKGELVKVIELIHSADEKDEPMVFCHNDLLSANIVYEPSSDGEVNFIDYEYGCFNYAAFDLANHFNEWAGFDCEFELCPTDQEKREWITQYLTKRCSLENIKMTELRVESMLDRVNCFIIVSHFFWGLWALVQAELSDIDFDYMTYALLRFEEYQKKLKERKNERK